MTLFICALLLVLAVCLAVAVIGPMLLGPHSPISDIDPADDADDPHLVACARELRETQAERRAAADAAQTAMVA